LNTISIPTDNSTNIYMIYIYIISYDGDGASYRWVQRQRAVVVAVVVEEEGPAVAAAGLEAAAAAAATAATAATPSFFL